MGGAVEVVGGSPLLPSSCSRCCRLMPPLPSSRAEHGLVPDPGAADPAEEGLGDGGERQRKGMGMEVGLWEAAEEGLGAGGGLRRWGMGEAGRQHRWGEYMVNLNIWAGLGLLSFNLFSSLFFFSLLLSNYRHCCNMLLPIVTSYYYYFLNILKHIHISGYSIKCSITVSVSAGYRYTYPYPCCVDGLNVQVYI
jgi:hypothetical protein